MITQLHVICSKDSVLGPLLRLHLVDIRFCLLLFHLAFLLLLDMSNLFQDSNSNGLPCSRPPMQMPLSLTSLGWQSFLLCVCACTLHYAETSLTPTKGHTKVHGPLGISLYLTDSSSSTTTPLWQLAQRDIKQVRVHHLPFSLRASSDSIDISQTLGSYSLFYIALLFWSTLPRY